MDSPQRPITDSPQHPTKPLTEAHDALDALRADPSYTTEKRSSRAAEAGIDDAPVVRLANSILHGAVGAGMLALSVVSVAVLGVSGFLGGKLAYRYGVRVADETTQADGYAPDGPTDAARPGPGT